MLTPLFPTTAPSFQDPSDPVASILASALARLEDVLLELVVGLPVLALALVLFLLFWILGRWASAWDAPYRGMGRNPFVRNLVRQVVRVVVVLAGALLALEILDATALVGAVLGTAGIMGLALGFAFKDIVENYLAGVILSLRQPFAPNDHIVLDSHEGKVVRLTARETVLMTPEGNHLRIPNATIFRSVLLNYTRNPRRRFSFTLPVGRDQDLGAAQETGIGVLGRVPGVLVEPPPAARISAVTESRADLQLLAWVDQTRADLGKVRSEAVRLVLSGLAEAGVAMPPPEYRVRTGTLEEAAPEAKGPPPRPESVDVAPDRTLDAQIDEDRRRSPEGDLLEEG